MINCQEDDVDPDAFTLDPMPKLPIDKPRYEAMSRGRDCDR